MARDGHVRHVRRGSRRISAVLTPSGPHRLVPSAPSRATLLRGLESGWSAVSYLIGGIVVWGGAGYVLDRLLPTRPVLTIIGVLVGNAAGIYLLYLRWPTHEGDRREA